MREVYLEGRLMTDRAAAHAEIKDKLSLPEYYGANLDALWDCLIEIGEETVITVRHPGAMFSALREYGCRLLMTFFEAEKENPVLYKYLRKYRVSEEEFNSCEYVWTHLSRYTFCIDTQISTSRELNRVSPNNISEQSTRYVYEDGVICKPHWMSDEIATYFNKEPLFEDWINNNIEHQKAYQYFNSCNDSFINYAILVNKFNINRQDARGVLPLDTATRCIYTYSIDEWRNIIDLRYYGTTGKPHPNAKIIAGMIRKELMELGYDFK